MVKNCVPIQGEFYQQEKLVYTRVGTYKALWTESTHEKPEIEGYRHLHTL